MFTECKASSPGRWTFIVLVFLAGCARYQPRPLLPSESAAILEARTLDNPSLREFLERNLQRKADEWPPRAWDFDMLNFAALYYHPSLDVARAQWQTAVAGQKTAAARPNPVLSVAPGYDLSPTGPTSPWFPAVTLDIPLEVAGKRGYRIAQARHLSESARWNIATVAWQVRSNLRLSLIDYTAARLRAVLLQNQKAIQDKIVRSLEQQAEAGAIPRSQLTLVRIALDRIRLDLMDSQQQSADARVRVADAIGISVKALDGVELAYDLSEPVALDLLSPEARRQALLGRADILAALAEYAATQSALQLEVAKQYPDLHLGPGYQYDQGDHKFSLSATLELPILNQNQGPIAQAQAKRTETAARFNALQAKIIAEIDRALAGYRVARETLAALESLAASQKQQNESVVAQLKEGAADQLDLFNSQIELAASELIQLTSRVKLQQSLGTLEDALQRPITSMNPAFIEQSHRSEAFKAP